MKAFYILWAFYKLKDKEIWKWQRVNATFIWLTLILMGCEIMFSSWFYSLCFFKSNPLYPMLYFAKGQVTSFNTQDLLTFQQYNNWKITIYIGKIKKINGLLSLEQLWPAMTLYLLETTWKTYIRSMGVHVLGK